MQDVGRVGQMDRYDSAEADFLCRRLDVSTIERPELTMYVLLRTSFSRLEDAEGAILDVGAN